MTWTAKQNIERREKLHRKLKRLLPSKEMSEKELDELEALEDVAVYWGNFCHGDEHCHSIIDWIITLHSRINLPLPLPRSDAWHGFHSLCFSKIIRITENGHIRPGENGWSFGFEVAACFVNSTEFFKETIGEIIVRATKGMQADFEEYVARLKKTSAILWEFVKCGRCFGRFTWQRCEWSTVYSLRYLLTEANDKFRLLPRDSDEATLMSGNIRSNVQPFYRRLNSMPGHPNLSKLVADVMSECDVQRYQNAIVRIDEFLKVEERDITTFFKDTTADAETFIDNDTNDVPPLDYAEAFDSETMITIRELVKMAPANRGDRWVRTRLAKAKIVKCYARKRANEPDGYPRRESIGVIVDAGKNG